MIEYNLDRDNRTFHIDIAECKCEGCTKKKDWYVRINDFNRFVENLSDWDLEGFIGEKFIYMIGIWANPMNDQDNNHR